MTGNTLLSTNQIWLSKHDKIQRKIVMIYKGKKGNMIRIERLSDGSIATLSEQQFIDMIEFGCYTLIS